MDNQETYTLRQASELLGIPLSTVRYYYRKGLIPHARRLGTGYRILDHDQLDWVQTIDKLHRFCGLSVDELKKYTWLSRQGKATITERLAILDTKKRQLWQELEDLKDGIDFIERREDILRKSSSSDEKISGQWI